MSGAEEYTHLQNCVQFVYMLLMNIFFPLRENPSFLPDSQMGPRSRATGLVERHVLLYMLFTWTLGVLNRKGKVFSLLARDIPGFAHQLRKVYTMRPLGAQAHVRNGRFMFPGLDSLWGISQ